MFGWSEKVEGLLQLLECPNNTFRTTFGLNGRPLVEKHCYRVATSIPEIGRVGASKKAHGSKVHGRKRKKGAHSRHEI